MPRLRATTTDAPAGHAVPAPRAGRAAAMAPEARRAAIVEATLPLLHLHGAAVTTRQIAEAAGIAEGTIFRAFPDKDSLITAAMEKAFDPAPAEAALAAIDLGLALEPRLEAAVAILQERFASVWHLMTKVGMTLPPDEQAGRRRSTDLAAVARLFAPDAHRLRRAPLDAADLLRSLTLACSHPLIVTDTPRSPAEIVAVLLDGIRTPAP